MNLCCMFTPAKDPSLGGTLATLVVYSLFIYGNARDYMAFPVSLPDDGLIDVMAMPLVSQMLVEPHSCH